MNCPSQNYLERRHNSHNEVKHFLCKILRFEVAQTSMDIMADSADNRTVPECIDNPIMAIGFSAMFTFQLDNTKRQTLPAPHSRSGSCIPT